LTAPDGRRLSKREKDLDLGELRKSHTPEQLLGKLAHLAGVLETPEPASAREIARVFDWNNVKTKPIVMEGF
jgi:glutamyl-tRNA synthetase